MAKPMLFDDIERRRLTLSAELRRLKYLSKTRHAGLDSGQIVQRVVQEMSDDIKRIEAELKALDCLNPEHT